MQSPKRNLNTAERQTFKNFTQMLKSGQFSEILKVIRRRFLNLLKFIRRLIGLIYDQPVLLRRRQKKLLRKVLAQYYAYPNQTNGQPGLKVALIIRDGTTHPKSSAFIRLIGPLTQPSLSSRLGLQIFPDNTTDIGPDFNICIVQRTAFDDLASAQALVGNLKSKSIALVVDTDDAFHSMDNQHPEHDEQSDTAIALEYLLQAADHVWVSTKQLKNHLPKTRQPAIVIDNSLDKRVWQSGPPKQSLVNASALEILYMGTATHDADLAMILPSLDKLAQDYPKSFKLTVMGVATDMPDRPWINKLSQRRHQSIYPGFVNWFLQQGPFDIGLAPLVDSDFNKDKSDIKCLDYIAAGILPVVSNVDAYRTAELNDFVIKVNNSADDWYKQLESLVQTIAELRKNKDLTMPKAQNYIWTKRSAEVTAQKLLDQIESFNKKSI